MLPNAVLLRRLATVAWRACCRQVRWQRLPAEPQQQTRRTLLLQRSTDGTDRRTDGHRTVTNTLPHTMRALSIKYEGTNAIRTHTFCSVSFFYRLTVDQLFQAAS